MPCFHFECSFARLIAEMMLTLYEKVQKAAKWIEQKTEDVPKHGIILGTGLGDFTFDESPSLVIQYQDIPHFPISTVQSHAGEMIIGKIKGVSIIVMAGRFHFYEGYTAKEVTFPIRVLKALGIKHLYITNAAGGINPHYTEGDIVIVQDHINMMPDHPLRGPNDLRLGVRFPDMLHAYDKQKITKFHQIAKKLNIQLHQGVYLALQGPSLETPAEYKMAHILGADLVGMSTVPEVIVANHEGMLVTAFSIVSNVCFPSSILTTTTVDEVIRTVQKSAGKLQNILNTYFENVTLE